MEICIYRQYIQFRFIILLQENLNAIKVSKSKLGSYKKILIDSDLGEHTFKIL
mgnify:FL=1